MAVEIDLTPDEIMFVKRIYRLRRWIAHGFWVAIGTAVASLLLDALT